MIEIVGGARKGFEDAPIGDVLCARDGDFVVAKFGDCELCHGESVVDVFAGGVCVGDGEIVAGVCREGFFIAWGNDEWVFA